MSPGGINTVGTRGTPRIFVAHGNLDGILPVSNTRDHLVPDLRASGYDVTYREFEGDHPVDPEVGEEAVAWFAGGA